VPCVRTRCPSRTRLAGRLASAACAAALALALTSPLFPSQLLFHATAQRTAGRSNFGHLTINAPLLDGHPHGDPKAAVDEVLGPALPHPFRTFLTGDTVAWGGGGGASLHPRPPTARRASLFVLPLPGSLKAPSLILLAVLCMVLAAAAGFYAGIRRTKARTDRLVRDLRETRARLQEAQVRANSADDRANEAREASEDKARQVERLEDEVERLTSVDGLSGLLNRRRFDDCLKEEWRRMYRSKKPLALILADVDSFRPFNETYGRPEGDECLRGIADFLARSFNRVGDIVARFDGDAFAVILTDTDSNEALRQAERLRAGVRAMAIPNEHSLVDTAVTVSLGLVSVSPRIVVDMEDALAAAEKAMRKACADGGNRIGHVEEGFHAGQA